MPASCWMGRPCYEYSAAVASPFKVTGEVKNKVKNAGRNKRGAIQYEMQI